MRGELDWIVMKALEKERSRRYETASGFALDIRRYLNDEPVAAGPPTVLYRSKTLVRRHKLAFAAACAVVAALTAAAGLSAWAFLREHAAREAAKKEAVKSWQVAGFLKDMLKGVRDSVALGRDTTMLREILEKTAERVSKELKDQPEVEADLRLTIGASYLDLGDFAKAEKMHREALRLRKLLFGGEDPSVADSLQHLATVLMADHADEHEAEAEAVIREALSIRKKLFGETNLDVTESLITLGALLSGRGEQAEAETMQRQALATRKRLLGDEHPEVAKA